MSGGAEPGLALTAEEVLLRDTAGAFVEAKGRLSELRRLRDSADLVGFSRPLWEEMAGLGWAGLAVPTELGGSSAGWFALGIVAEELGRQLTPSPLLSVVLAEACLVADTTGNHAKLLTGLAEGRSLVAVAFDEGSRHDPHRVATMAEVDGGGYRLRGRKTFVPDAHVVDRLVVAARVKAGWPGGDPLGLFLVDPATPGVEIRPGRLVDSRLYSEILLEDVSVPADSLIGGPDWGAAVLDAALDRGRAVLAAEMLGGATRALELTIAHLKDRRQFGAPIGSFQALQHRAARLHLAVELTRSVVADALRGLDAGADDAAERVSTAKACASDTFRLVANEAVQLHGGLGITDECNVGLYLKRSRVAERLLGDGSFHRRRLAALNGF